MPNHLHIIWQMQGDKQLSSVQQRLLKFVSQQIKFDLIAHHPQVLATFKSNRTDRHYHFWKEKPLSIALLTDNVVKQKMDYLHNNPIQENGIWQNKQGIIAFPPTVFMKWANQNGRF